MRYIHHLLLGLILIPVISASLSAQGGVSWQRLEGPYGGTVSRMAADSSGNLYAVLGSLSSSTIYMMEKGSGRWSDKGTVSVRIQDLASTPDGVLMAGTEGAGVIRSTDHGATWNPASGFDNGFVWGLAVMADGSVAAGGQFGDVSVSADNGDSWTRVAVMPNQVFIQAIAIGAGGELFIGSTDSGLYVLPPGGGMVRKVGLGGGITALRVAGGDLIAGTSKGEVHRVVASGGSWTVAASDTLDGRVSSIDVGPGGSLIASTANGIHIAAGGGFDWRRVDVAPLPPAIGSLVVGRDGELYAGTQDGVFGAPSIDGATISFAPMSAGLTGERISSIAPIGGRELVVGTMSSSLYRSTDDGASWSSVMTVPVSGGMSTFNGINALAAKGEELYASAYGGGILRSTDGGMSWSARNGGLPDLLTIGVAIDSAGGVIASLVSDGLYRSTDAGESWRKLGGPSDYFAALTVAPDGSLVAATGEGVVRSTDNGATWKSVRKLTRMVTSLLVNGAGEILLGTLALPGESAGIYRIGSGNVMTLIGSSRGSVNALLRDASGGIYVGTDSGAYMIAPGGTALTPINDGLTIPTVSSLALRDGRIYAGTAGALFVATVAPSSVEEEMMAERGASGGFVPNPVRGAASLGFTIASPQHVTLDIYDAAGSHVATLLAGRVEAGEHRVSWSTEGVPAGGYLWRLRGSRWSRGGMVVVR